MYLHTINDPLVSLDMLMSPVIKAVQFRSALRSRSGQAMVEYVVIAGTLMATTLIFLLFQGTFNEFGTRVLNLIGSEYP